MVERPAKPLVPGKNQDPRTPASPRLQEKGIGPSVLAHDELDPGTHIGTITSAALEAGLAFSKTRRGDHFHGAGDLLNIPDGLDPVFYFLDLGQNAPPGNAG
jgi:hypothetical protein